jgi:hypothetical protein
MNLQLRWELYFAQQDEKAILREIQPYVIAEESNSEHYDAQ